MFTVCHTRHFSICVKMNIYFGEKKIRAIGINKQKEKTHTQCLTTLNHSLRQKE